MKRFDYEKQENISASIVQVAENIAEIAQNKNVLLNVNTWKVLIDYLHNIPDDVKKMEIFKKVHQLESKTLCYEDALWLIEDFRQESMGIDWLNQTNKGGTLSELQKYIKKIILSNNIETREKLIIVLAHTEPLFYETLKISKKVNIKKDVTNITLHKNKGRTRENFLKVYVLGVMYIIFANTDRYEKIDRRMPFRNNILHNGIIGYSDEEIKSAYEVLIDLIEILVYAKDFIQ